MFKIPRSFRVIRFLNQKHGLIVRLVFSLSAFLIVTIATLRLSFGKHVFSIFMSNEFKDAGRLSGWYIRNGWTGYDISYDPFFDFTGISSDELLEKQACFLKSRYGPSTKIANPYYYGYQASILAEKAHRVLRANNERLFLDYYEKYLEYLNHLLACLNKVEKKISADSSGSNDEGKKQFL